MSSHFEYLLTIGAELFINVASARPLTKGGPTAYAWTARNNQGRLVHCEHDSVDYDPPPGEPEVIAVIDALRTYQPRCKALVILTDCAELAIYLAGCRCLDDLRGFAEEWSYWIRKSRAEVRLISCKSNQRARRAARLAQFLAEQRVPLIPKTDLASFSGVTQAVAAYQSRLKK